MKIGKFDISIITQKLITSKKLIKNKFRDGSVLFEKYEPEKWATLSSGTFYGAGGSISGSASMITISGISNRTTIGNSNNPGGYDIGGTGDFVLLVAKKPNFFHRNMVKFIFGWRYIDSKNK